MGNNRLVKRGVKHNSKKEGFSGDYVIVKKKMESRCRSTGILVFLRQDETKDSGINQK